MKGNLTYNDRFAGGRWRFLRAAPSPVRADITARPAVKSSDFQGRSDVEDDSGHQLSSPSEN